MTWLLWSAGIVLALAWVSRIIDAGLGMPTIADIAKPEWDRHLDSAPRVSVIVPARNEEKTIAQGLTQLLALDYENYEVIAVNDRSTDATGELMQQVAAGPAAHGCLRVVNIETLPDGWLGKTHAMWTASTQATGDWLLFTDADILYKPSALRRAVAYAESVRADHLVLFPRLLMHSPGERVMIAFFQILFTFGHRPWKVADPKTRDHIGVGAFNLVRRSAYEAVGTYRALRMEVVDDMKLGKVLKNAGFSQRTAFGEDLISLHWGSGALGVAANFTKNFFAVLSYQSMRTIAVVGALAFLNLGPFLGLWLAHAWQRVPYALALLSIFAMYVGMSAREPIPPYYFFLHPIGTLFFIYALLRSMMVTLWHGGVTWRGTKYPLEELRKGLV
jgi:cellulose synthase/poly-beta-1,6-N-acetylglucosamine synthase-like glycosyltransferase